MIKKLVKARFRDLAASRIFVISITNKKFHKEDKKATTFLKFLNLFKILAWLFSALFFLLMNIVNNLARNKDWGFYILEKKLLVSGLEPRAAPHRQLERRRTRNATVRQQQPQEGPAKETRQNMDAIKDESTAWMKSKLLKKSGKLSLHKRKFGCDQVQSD